jgi:type I restriction enzyme S subunit
MRPGYVQTEIGVIPEDWGVYSVRDMGEVVTGKALAAHAAGRPRPYLRTKNVFDGRIDINDVLSMPMTDEQFAHFQLRGEDVLLNEGQSLELVGRCSLYSDEYPEPCAIQNQLLRFRARKDVSAAFSSHLFRYCQQKGVFARVALQTTSIAHLGGSRFERLRLAWPATETEQRAIATALSDADALLGALDRLIAKKRALKQAAMQQLLTGKPATLGDTGANVQQTANKLITGTWELVPVKARGQVEAGKALNVKGPGARRAYLRTTNVLDGRIDLNDVLSMPMTDTEFRHFSLRFGDVLLNEGQSLELVGRCSLYRDEFGGPCAMQNQLLRFRATPGTSPDYAAHLFRFCQQTGIFAQIATQTTSVAHLGVSRLQNLKLPWPSKLHDQEAIAIVLSDMDAEVTALEARHDKSRELKEAMMQELLTGKTRLVQPEAAHASKRDAADAFQPEIALA